MAGRFTIQGAKELQAKLEALPVKIEKKLGRQAERAGAKVIAAQEKANAPRKTGKLAAAVKVKAPKRKRGRSSVMMLVQAAYGDTFYGRFIEWGRRIGRRNRETERLRKLGEANAADTRKEVPPNPFLQKSFDETKQQAADVVLQTLRDGIEREAGQ